MVGPLLGERFGLTFKYDEVIRHMIVTWNYRGELDFTQIQMKEIYNGLQYEDNDHQVIWDINDILDSIRILDSIPFKNIDIIRTTKAFPLIFKRQNIAVFVAPRMLKLIGDDIKLKESAMDYAKFDRERDNQPIIEERSNLIGNWILVNRFNYSNVECGNCGAQLHPSDWYNRVYVENHPDCFCMCDCSNCIYAREVQQYMIEARDRPSFRKKLTTKN